FRFTPSGVFRTLYSFCSLPRCSDGDSAEAGLIQGTDGNLYGTTVNGGANDDGTVFQITPRGALTILHSFDGTDGLQPYGGLVQGTDGNFYGTTTFGGTNNDGTVFSVATGLAPFVETLPTLSKVGATVKILGNNLTGTTAVTFNSIAATFNVVSDT